MAGEATFWTDRHERWKQWQADGLIDIYLLVPIDKRVPPAGPGWSCFACGCFAPGSDAPMFLPMAEDDAGRPCTVCPLCGGPMLEATIEPTLDHLPGVHAESEALTKGENSGG